MVGAIIAVGAVIVMFIVIGWYNGLFDNDDTWGGFS